MLHSAQVGSENALGNWNPGICRPDVIGLDEVVRKLQVRRFKFCFGRLSEPAHDNFFLNRCDIKYCAISHGHRWWIPGNTGNWSSPVGFTDLRGAPGSGKNVCFQTLNVLDSTFLLIVPEYKSSLNIKLDQILTIKDRTKFPIICLVKINHSHESKDRILPHRVFPLPD